MTFISHFFMEVWHILQESSFYILFGISIGGLLKVVMSTDTVAKHLGNGRFLPVLKAALFGIPLPLCSCGVLPAATAIREQGANRGATTAFLVSTPESGIDSISTTWALLDPLMTAMRPIAAFCTAFVAGVLENIFFWEEKETKETPEKKQVDTISSCCSSKSEAHAPLQPLSIPMAGLSNMQNKQTEQNLFGKLFDTIRSASDYAINSVWSAIARWFFIGIFIAALITVSIPDAWMERFLGGGFSSMLIMLVAGIPLYICATASTPVAAALILKGVSPGTALVFLLVGPATNITSLSVLMKILGKKSTLLYLAVVSISAVLFGYIVDWLYVAFAISPKAVVGSASEMLPHQVKTCAALILLAISLRPYVLRAVSFYGKR